MDESKEESKAKRRRMETSSSEPPGCSEQIIQELRMDLLEHRRIIQNLQAQLAIKDKRIQELEQKEGKIISSKNLMELPDECLLKILGYLSNFEVLRVVPRVSKKFHQLSQDRHLIKKIKVDSKSWPENQEEEYCQGFIEVIKRSINLSSLSFDFGKDPGAAGEMFLKALTSMNHQYLKELCLKSDGLSHDNTWPAFDLFEPINEDVLKYFERCSNLKVLKFEFNPYHGDLDYEILIHPRLSWIEDSGITTFKPKNLEEFHLIGFRIDKDKSSFKEFLENFVENLPKLQRLCLTAESDCEYEEEGWDEYAKICQEVASEKYIQLEIRGVPVLCNFDDGIKSICCGHYNVHPSKDLQIYCPI